MFDMIIRLSEYIFTYHDPIDLATFLFMSFFIVVTVSGLIFYWIGVKVERGRYQRYLDRKNASRPMPPPTSTNVIASSPSMSGGLSPIKASSISDNIESIKQCQINEMSDIKLMQFDLSAIKAKQIEHSQKLESIIEFHKPRGE
ncbi:MAG: hypothetical protein FWC16_01980 [Defluviitaleaceae bacterium]|nr:hypothetical protein [Defluviitaleaceae bacterium]MCL2273668.1 hypothetical protein [Defluviitaleaceae bacterium]